jgi:hypothetical protein
MVCCVEADIYIPESMSVRSKGQDCHIIYTIRILLYSGPITVAALSKAWNEFAR